MAVHLPRRDRDLVRAAGGVADAGDGQHAAAGIDHQRIHAAQRLPHHDATVAAMRDARPDMVTG